MYDLSCIWEVLRSEFVICCDNKLVQIEGAGKNGLRTTSGRKKEATGRRKKTHKEVVHELYSSKKKILVR
jgi:hypothetical protein